MHKIHIYTHCRCIYEKMCVDVYIYIYIYTRMQVGISYPKEKQLHPLLTIHRLTVFAPCLVDA